MFKRLLFEHYFAAAKIAIAVGNSSHFQDLGMHFVPTITPGCEHVSAHTNEYWKCMARHQTSTLFHPVGTAKMGPRSDPMAVVDPELRYKEV